MFYSGNLRIHLNLHRQLKIALDFICQLHLNRRHKVIDLNSCFFLQTKTAITAICDFNDRNRSALNCLATGLHLVEVLGSLPVLAPIVTGNAAMRDGTLITLRFGLMITVTFTTYNFCALNSISDHV